MKVIILVVMMVLFCSAVKANTDGKETYASCQIAKFEAVKSIAISL